MGVKWPDHRPVKSWSSGSHSTKRTSVITSANIFLFIDVQNTKPIDHIPAIFIIREIMKNKSLPIVIILSFFWGIGYQQKNNTMADTSTNGKIMTGELKGVNLPLPAEINSIS